MKITVVISAMLIAQVSASFFDAFQGAVLSVQNSFGKLLSDVVTDVKETVDCTLLAVEHVLALNEDATSRYYSKCGSETSDNPTAVETQTTVKPAPKVDITFEVVNSGNNREVIKNVDSSDLSTKLNETVLQLLNKFSAQDKLYSVNNVLVEETKQIVNVSDQVKTQLEKFSNVHLSNISTSNLNDAKPSVDNVLKEIKLLEKRERSTENSSEAVQIHGIIDNILNKLEVISATEATENEKIEHLLIDLEKESSTSFNSLKKEFDEWKVEENIKLGDIRNRIEDRGVLNNHVQVNKVVLLEDKSEKYTTSNKSSITNTTTWLDVSNEELTVNTTNETFLSNTSLHVTEKITTTSNASENAFNKSVVTKITPDNDLNESNLTEVNGTYQSIQLDNEVSNVFNAVTISYSVYKNISNLTTSKYEIDNVKDPPIKNTSTILIHETLSNNDTINTRNNSNLFEGSNYMTVSTIDSSLPDNKKYIDPANNFNGTVKAGNDSITPHNATNLTITTSMIQKSTFIGNSEMKTQENATYRSNETDPINVLKNLTVARILNDTQHTSVLQVVKGNTTDFANTAISTLNNVTSNTSVVYLDETTTTDTVVNKTLFKNNNFTKTQNNTQRKDNLQTTSEVINYGEYVPRVTYKSNNSANFLTTKNLTLDGTNRNSASNFDEVKNSLTDFANTTVSNFTSTNVTWNSYCNETVHMATKSILFKNDTNSETLSSTHLEENIQHISGLIKNTERKIHRHISNNSNKKTKLARSLNETQLNSTLTLLLDNGENKSSEISNITVPTLNYFMSSNVTTNNSIDNSNKTIDSYIGIKTQNDSQLNNYLQSTTVTTTLPTLHTTNEYSILQNSTTMVDYSSKTANVTSQDLTEVNESHDTNKQNSLSNSTVVENETISSNIAEIISGDKTRKLSNIDLKKESLKSNVTHKSSNSTTSNTFYTSTAKNNENVTALLEKNPTITESEIFTLKTSYGSIEMKFENVITTSNNAKSAEEELPTDNINRLTISEINEQLASNSSTYTPQPLKTVQSEVIETLNTSTQSDRTQLYPANRSQDDYPLSAEKQTVLNGTTVVNTPYTYVTSTPQDEINVPVSELLQALNVTTESDANSPKVNNTENVKSEAITIPDYVQKYKDPKIKDTNVTNTIINLLHSNIGLAATTNTYENIANNKTRSVKSDITSNSISAASSQNYHQIVMTTSNEGWVHSESDIPLTNNDVPVKPVVKMSHLESAAIVNQPISATATVEVDTQIINVPNNLYPQKFNSIETSTEPVNMGTKKGDNNLNAETRSLLTTTVREPLAPINSYPILNNNDKMPLPKPSENPTNDINSFFSRTASKTLVQAGNSPQSIKDSNYQNVDSVRNDHVSDNQVSNRMVVSERQEINENGLLETRNSVITKQSSILNTGNSNSQLQLERSAPDNLYIPPNLRESSGAVPIQKHRHHHHSYTASEVQARQQALKNARELISSSRQQDHILNNIRRHRNRAKSVFSNTGISR